MISLLLSLFGTILLFVGVKRLYIQSKGKMFLNPMIVCPIVLALSLLLMGVPYREYALGGDIISWMLQPSTVAFAVPLYRYRDKIKKYGVEMTIVILSASIVALVTSVGLTILIGLGLDLAMSMAPRSITTPLALAAAEVVGGIPTITAVLVIITGVMGMVMTSAYVERHGIRNTFARGMLFGVSAHGTGTAKAYEYGAETGAIASVSMILMGIFTTLLAPLVSFISSFLK